MLENGQTTPYATDSGWLNRALQAMGPGKVKAISVGATAPLILRGPVEAASWSPAAGAGRDPRLPAILADLYAHDPMLSRALASGLATEAMAKGGERRRQVSADADDRRGDRHGRRARRRHGRAGRRRRRGAAPGAAPGPADGSPARRDAGRLHDRSPAARNWPPSRSTASTPTPTRARAQGQLATRLAYLDAALDGIAKGMGPAWKDTAVVVVTEFGRTARVNGTGGTDHGTASTALLLGGALKRRAASSATGRRSPTRKLFENRDTAPTPRHARPLQGPAGRPVRHGSPRARHRGVPRQRSRCPRHRDHRLIACGAPQTGWGSNRVR